MDVPVTSEDPKALPEAPSDDVSGVDEEVVVTDGPRASEDPVAKAPHEAPYQDASDADEVEVVDEPLAVVSQAEAKVPGQRSVSSVSTEEGLAAELSAPPPFVIGSRSERSIRALEQAARSCPLLDHLQDLQLKALPATDTVEHNLEELLDELFTLLDKDGSGGLSRMELLHGLIEQRGLFRTLGLEDSNQVEEFLADADVDENGSIDKEELVAEFRRRSSVEPRTERFSKTRSSRLEQIQDLLRPTDAAVERDLEKILDELFTLLDEDGSDGLSRMELLRGLVKHRASFKMLGLENAEQVEKFLADADCDNNGSIDREELVAEFRRRSSSATSGP